MSLIKHISNKDYESANEILEENFKVILESKLHEMKKMYAATMEQNTPEERMKRLKADVLEEDDAEEKPATGNFTPIQKPGNMDKTLDDLSSTLKRMKQHDLEHGQPARLRSGYSTIAEDEQVDEGLLKVARDTLKKLSPVARANQRKPIMKNIEGKPLGKKLKIAPKRIEEETEQLDEAPRVGIVKLRVRGGKVQRRKKVSNVPGMTLRGGKLTRMSPSERRRRKLGAKKAARKAKTKRFQALRKRKMSLLKRARLGG